MSDIKEAPRLNKEGRQSATVSEKERLRSKVTNEIVLNSSARANMKMRGMCMLKPASVVKKMGYICICICCVARVVQDS
jgi:hypothetical protein